MVVNKAKQNENEPEKRERSALIEALEQEDETVVALAYFYAKGFALSGADVTKAWTNAIQNNQVIENVYRKGYTDCEKDYAEKRRRDFYHKVIVDLKDKERL